MTLPTFHVDHVYEPSSNPQNPITVTYGGVAASQFPDGGYGGVWTEELTEFFGGFRSDILVAAYFGPDGTQISPSIVLNSGNQPYTGYGAEILPNEQFLAEWSTFSTGARASPVTPTSVGFEPSIFALVGTAGDDNLLIDPPQVALVEGLDGTDVLQGATYQDGGLGADTMIGGAGTNVFWVDNIGDVIGGELAGAAGLDTVMSQLLSYVLPDNIENLVLLPGAVDGVGNAGDNVITGNFAANTIAGGSGTDKMLGGGGDDTLVGGPGNDILIGEAGVDTAVYSGPHSAYHITLAGSGFQVSGPDGIDILTAVERLAFIDSTIQVPALKSDFDADLNADLLWQASDGMPAIWKMEGTTLVGGSPLGFNPGSTWTAIKAADFNGDGNSDILWQDSDGKIAVWEMNGFSMQGNTVLPFNPGASWKAITTGDFDGDAKTDILWQNSGDGTPVIWLMDGLDTKVNSGSLFNPGPAWRATDTADFNCDGKSDILWQNTDGTPVIWLMDGTTMIANSGPLFNPGSSWKEIGTGDFNADGNSDILWQNSDGTPAIWLMDGATVIGNSGPLFNPGPDWHALHTDDFNSDGKADILWQNNDGRVDIWKMDGMHLIGATLLPFNPGSDWHLI